MLHSTLVTCFLSAATKLDSLVFFSSQRPARISKMVSLLVPTTEAKSRLLLNAKPRKKGPPPRMLFKITVLGDGGVGKTAITVQVSPACHLSLFVKEPKES